MVQPTQLIKSRADPSQELDQMGVDQSSFEKLKFRSPGGTIPKVPPEEDLDNKRESFQIFKDVMNKVLTSPGPGTPTREAFQVLMCSTPQPGGHPKPERTPTGIPLPRSRSQKG